MPQISKTMMKYSYIHRLDVMVSVKIVVPPYTIILMSDEEQH
jgi:hypothetical protein